MRSFTRLFCGACLAALTAGVASAATLIPVVAVPGAVRTNVFGINDHNVVVGDYTDSDGIEHGFFGPLDGSGYTTFDYGSSALGTEARGIDKAGNIAGFAPDESGAIGPEFLRLANGTFVAIEKDGVQLEGIAQGLGRHIESVGDYVSDPETNAKLGYLAKRGVYKNDVTLSVPATTVRPRAMAGNTIAGWFDDDAGSHGFILKGGVTQVIDVDDSGTTTLEGYNHKGVASGQVVDADTNNHAFVMDKHGTVTFIDVPGSTEQQAWGINSKGLVAVTADAGSGSFIYCPLKPSRCPAGGTEIKTTRTAQVSFAHAMSYRAGAARKPVTRRNGAQP